MLERYAVHDVSVDAVDVGTLPPLGVVPRQMHAQVIRPDRYGDPATAFVHEVVDTPSLGPGEVLIAVMAAGGMNASRITAMTRKKRGEPNS